MEYPVLIDHKKAQLVVIGYLLLELIIAY